MVGDVTFSGFTFRQDDWVSLDDEARSLILSTWSYSASGEDYYAEYEVSLGAS